MLHVRPIQAADSRRGVILLVVLALLTLFAIVGLSFVLYADSEATSSRIGRCIHRRAANHTRTSPTLRPTWSNQMPCSLFVTPELGRARSFLGTSGASPPPSDPRVGARSRPEPPAP